MIHATQSSPQSKIAGWIDLMKNDNFHSQLLSTKEVYETLEEAETAMKELCEWCVDWYRMEATNG